MMIIRDTLSCGVTYDRHSGSSRGVIYTPREYSSLMTIIIYDRHMFIVQDLGFISVSASLLTGTIEAETFDADAT